MKTPGNPVIGADISTTTDAQLCQQHDANFRHAITKQGLQN